MVRQEFLGAECESTKLSEDEIKNLPCCLVGDMLRQCVDKRVVSNDLRLETIRGII